MTFKHSQILGLAFAALISNSANAAQPDRNAQLEAAASACEDMIEIAQANGVAAAMPKIKVLKSALDAVRTTIPAEGLAQIDAKVLAIASASKTGSATEFSLLAVETFKDILSVMEWQDGPNAKRVALLDYQGFKLSILSNSSKPDWPAIAQTAQETTVNWQALKPALQEKALQDLGSNVAKGIEQGSDQKNSGQVLFAAIVLLDSVDLIENAMAKTP